MKKKKILYIGNRLSKHGLNVTTIETLGKLLEEDGYIVLYASDKKSFFIRLFDMLLSILKYSYKVDYVLIDTYSSKAFWYAFLSSQLCRICRIKYIPILHGGNLPKRVEKSKITANLLFKNAFINISPSNYLFEEFKKNGIKNVKVIPNSIDLVQYNFSDRNAFSPKLLWVRSFAKIYNPMMAIYVFKGIIEKFPNAKLTMVGPDKDGTLLETKKLALKLGLEVSFTGRLSKKEWCDMSKKYDIFINTTHFDNMPVSVLEAISLGLPIISTKVGGIPYLLDESNSYLVEDNDINGMILAILNCIASPSDTVDKIKNAKRIVEKMDWNIIKEEWEKIFEN